MESKINLFEYLQNTMFLGVPASKNMGDKFALIGLLCQLYNVLKAKKSSVTMYQVVELCLGKGDIAMTATTLDSITAICEWFSYGCEKFPDMGVPPKEIPAKVKQLVLDMLPF